MAYFEGLVQHDQLKEEVMKQNLLPFLLDCTNTLDDKTLKQMFETLWSLTFREEAASALRSNDEFLEKIQRISQENKDEGLKKATDGLVWKLIQGIRFRCVDLLNLALSYRAPIFGESGATRGYKPSN